MEGALTYVYLPVTDLSAARTFYRDTLGLEESWREGEMACAFKLPGTTVQLMLNQTTAADPDTAGLVFTIAAVDPFFHEQQANIAFTGQPQAIPGNGRWVAAKDVSGHGLYFADVE